VTVAEGSRVPEDFLVGISTVPLPHTPCSIVCNVTNGWLFSQTVVLVLFGRTAKLLMAKEGNIRY
jgi:hypothetical protein